MIRGKNGDPYNLPLNPTYTGGEGSIYILSDGRVAKIYSEDILSEQIDELEAKIEYMVDNPPNGQIVTYMAWPIDTLYDNGRFCGFVMNDLQGFQEMKRIHAVSVKDTEPLNVKLQCAYNLAMMVAVVHRAGYVIGDFNPKNIGYNSRGIICFYDNDSFQFTDGHGHVFRCNVQFPGYVAPEILIETDNLRRKWVMEGKKGEVHMSDLSVGFTQDTDRFALAVHIFQLMMNGQPPYRTVAQGSQTDSNVPSQPPSSSSSTVAPKGDDDVKNDRYCFRTGYRPFSNITPRKELFPPYIMDLFDKAFRSLKSGEHRPSAEDWRNALDRYSSDVKKCCNDNRHLYWKSAPVCPYCDASARQKSSQSSPRQNAVLTSTPSNVISGGNQTTGQFGSVKPPSKNNNKPYSSNPQTTSVVSKPKIAKTSDNKQNLVWFAYLLYALFLIFLIVAGLQMRSSYYAIDHGYEESYAHFEYMGCLIIFLIIPGIIGSIFIFMRSEITVGIGILGICAMVFIWMPFTEDGTVPGWWYLALVASICLTIGSYMDPEAK